MLVQGRWSRAALVCGAVLMGVIAGGTNPVRGGDKAEVPLYEGLNLYGRKVTTSSSEAQKYFDQGLCFLYAFNHDEAIRSFQKATDLDPDCAMAWWGIAFANGPHINFPLVPPERATAAWDALQRAQQVSGGATETEKQFIEALAKRYADPQPEDRKPLDEAFAAAMRDVWKADPTDADVGALFAEAMMDLRPWDLWMPDGQAQPGTDEVVATLEAVLTQNPSHPLALHLYIHAVEASPQPQKAVAPGNRLRTLMPALGHLIHMPSHIDVRTGQWVEAMASNRAAMEADRVYRERSPQQEFYRIYMAHNHHMYAFAAMMRGQSKEAVRAIQEMTQTMPAEWVKTNGLFADGFMAMQLEVLVRFGRWDEILAAPEPPENLPFTRAMRHCARGIACAAKHEVENAKAEQAAFLKAKAAVPAESIVGNNTAADVLGVAEALLAGEVQVRSGEVAVGIAQLREAVAREERLRYSEPPDWIHPVRHALGATLMTDGQYAEAEKVYREDLTRLPNNGWSLYGLARSLRQQGKPEGDAVQTQFDAAWKDADVTITSSCFCQPGRPVEEKK
jgi:tetratricopeptide (TPR) repeat protein